MAPDHELLAAWRAGDAAAGEQLFDRYYDAVGRFFANKVAGQHADLVQQTFLGLVEGGARLQDPSRFRSFLFGIAYNVLRSHYGAKRAANDRFEPEPGTVADLAPGAGTMLAQSTEQRLLLEGLRRIPLDHQVVLELFYWEGMTSAAIADALGEPHGTIRTRLRTGRIRLAEAIQSLDGEPAVLRSTTSDLDGWAARVRQAQAARGAASA